MSEEIRPVFRPRVGGLVYEAEGKTLARQIRKIHAFSKKRELRPITDFLDNRDVPEDDFDDDEWQAARSDWHPPAEGVQAVRALLEAIRSDPKAAQRWNRDDPDGLETLLSDLEDLARCLEAATSHGVQFRLDFT
jgi:hypothetical protein